MKVTSSFPAGAALHAAAQAPDAPGALATTWQGLPAIRLVLECGDTALIVLQGAQLLSWQVRGEEQLFLSPQAAHDGQTPIRGGIPVCFPQFNQRGPLAKHGFARTLAWQGDASQVKSLEGDGLVLRLKLVDTPQTRAVWPHAFEAWLELTLMPGRADVELWVHNQGEAPLSFTAALHSYLRVADVQECRLRGLHGLRYWDAVADTHPTQQGDVAFGAELDRVYPRPVQGMDLMATGRRLRISQDAAWSETVVWNPGSELCARLADMPPQAWRQMLCVEAAAIDAPVLVPPGGRWRAAQRLQRL